MINKLRRKFILIAMLSIFVVLASIIATINILNYCKIKKDSDRILEVLIQNEGRFPQPESSNPNPPVTESPPDHKGMDGMSPETPFETRYFTVTVDENDILIADTGKIAAVSETEAKEITTKLLKKEKTSGMVDDYKYQMTMVEGRKMYVFLDCSRDLDHFRNFLLYSSLISAGGLFLVFILVIIFSRFALKPVEESYRKQKSFITNASHDIKTPLTIIGADAEVIELKHGTSDWTKDIKKQVERLTMLTDKLVFLSRMEENDYQLEVREFNFSDMLEETCFSYETTVKLQGLELVLEIESNINIKGNEDALRRSAALIMDNAVKYAKSYIKVSLRQSGNTIELRFINDANNIKQGNLNTFFDRFYRADLSRNSQTGGHGIGLSVVHSVISAHKGKINAYSPDGQTVVINIIL